MMSEMSATYEQLPGRMNLAFSQGDDFSSLIDFSISLESHTVSAGITSLVTGLTVLSFTTTFVSRGNGQVNISLTDTQTASLARGTYGWNLKWTAGDVTRTALTGMVEVA